MENNNGRLSGRVWIAIFVFMLMGTTAAGVETMYLSIFLNDTVFKDGTMGASLTLTDTVNLITSLTATMAGIAAFVMGTLSERMKNRKAFISIGYIVWGAVMVIFGAVNRDNVAKLLGLSDVAEIITVTAIMVVGFALVLAFLRATSSDAVFNSWLTDVSTPQTTTTIETVFTILGFVSTGILTVLISIAQSERMSYGAVFVVLGVAAIGIGVLGFSIIDDPKKFENAVKEDVKTNYWADLFYGFRPKAVKENLNLYLILLSGCLFNCAFQVFYPYLFLYIDSVVFPENKLLNLDGNGLIALALAGVTFSICCAAILMARVKTQKTFVFVASVVCYTVGLFILSSTTHIVGIIAGVPVMLVGYIIIMIEFAADVRNNIPQDKVGLFQGIRMIFLNFIPMIVGPTLGNIAAKNSNITYMSNGAEKVLPTKDMFLYAAIIGVMIFVPMLLFLKRDKAKRMKDAQETVTEETIEVQE